VRLYLTASLIYFALVAISPSNGNLRITAQDVPTEQLQEVMRRAEEANRHVQELVAHYAPRAMFVLMPFFGLLTWAFYRRSEPYYVPHLYYAIHVHAFAFLVFAAAKALQLSGAPDLGGILLVLAVVPYHYIALRRVFGGSRVQVAWKGTTIAVAYTLTIGAIFAGILWVELRPLLKDLRSNPS
jgi:hypothetical protein